MAVEELAGDDRPTPAPAAAAARSASLVARTRAMLPRPVGLGGRLGAWMAAAGRGTGTPPSPGAKARPLTAPPRPSELTVARRPSALERARAAWRATDYLERLDAAILEPRLTRCVTIAVVSPKGGVGKTTTTALLGMLLAHLRRDRIVAVDTNPDYGSLGRVLTPDQQLFVDDLLDTMSKPDLTLTALDAQLGRAGHGLMVLPAPTDPVRMARLDEEGYRTVIERLKTYVGVILLDCGTGLQEPAARAAIASCDQLVLITDAEPATASLVAEASRLLADAGKPITVVVNKLPSKTRLDLERLSTFLHGATSLTSIPVDPSTADRLSAGTFDWRDAPDTWARALRELAAVLVSHWRSLGLTLE